MEQCNARPSVRQVKHLSFVTVLLIFGGCNAALAQSSGSARPDELPKTDARGVPLASRPAPEGLIQRSDAYLGVFPEVPESRITNQSAFFSEERHQGSELQPSPTPQLPKSSPTNHSDRWLNDQVAAEQHLQSPSKQMPAPHPDAKEETKKKSFLQRLFGD
jgi:hypothetical protein